MACDRQEHCTHGTRSTTTVVGTSSIPTEARGHLRSRTCGASSLRRPSAADDTLSPGAKGGAETRCTRCRTKRGPMIAAEPAAASLRAPFNYSAGGWHDSGVGGVGGVGGGSLFFTATWLDCGPGGGEATDSPKPPSAADFTLGSASRLYPPLPRPPGPLLVPFELCLCNKGCRRSRPPSHFLPRLSK
jgi:hypothetical protein